LGWCSPLAQNPQVPEEFSAFGSIVEAMRSSPLRRGPGRGHRRSRVRSRLPPPTGFHSPRSTDLSSSSSSASIFRIGLLTEVRLRGLPARNDRLQEDRLLVLDERHLAHVVLAPDDEDALAGVTILARVLQDVEQVATLDVEDDVLEPDATVLPELRVLRVVSVEQRH
jgi:Asp-tRNA(Asn)/Glu-tRNA(Gln) amidotransferase C subunit